MSIVKETTEQIDGKILTTTEYDNGEIVITEVEV
jgi:hypothetical protein